VCVHRALDRPRDVCVDRPAQVDAADLGGEERMKRSDDEFHVRNSRLKIAEHAIGIGPDLTPNGGRSPWTLRCSIAPRRNKILFRRLEAGSASGEGGETGRRAPVHVGLEDTDGRRSCSARAGERSLKGSERLTGWAPRVGRQSRSRTVPGRPASCTSMRRYRLAFARVVHIRAAFAAKQASLFPARRQAFPPLACEYGGGGR